MPIMLNASHQDQRVGKCRLINPWQANIHITVSDPESNNALNPHHPKLQYSRVETTFQVKQL